MGHKHGVLVSGGIAGVSTFPNDEELKKFRLLVNSKATDEFNARLPQNEGKDFSTVRGEVSVRLMYVYISRELEGFDNYDKPYIRHSKI